MDSPLRPLCSTHILIYLNPRKCSNIATPIIYACNQNVEEFFGDPRNWGYPKIVGVLSVQGFDNASVVCTFSTLALQVDLIFKLTNFYRYSYSKLFLKYMFFVQITSEAKIYTNVYYIVFY